MAAQATSVINLNCYCFFAKKLDSQKVIPKKMKKPAVYIDENSLIPRAAT